MENKEAIEALRDLLDTTREYPHLDGMTMFGEAITLAITALKKQEQDRWIPVTERPPEEDKGLLVTDEYGEIRHAVYIDWHGKVEFRTIEESITLDNVKAWRPLTEPYQEEEA